MAKLPPQVALLGSSAAWSGPVGLRSRRESAGQGDCGRWRGAGRFPKDREHSRASAREKEEEGDCGGEGFVVMNIFPVKYRPVFLYLEIWDINVLFFVVQVMLPPADLAISLPDLASEHHFESPVRHDSLDGRFNTLDSVTLAQQGRWDGSQDSGSWKEVKVGRQGSSSSGRSSKKVRWPCVSD